MTLRDLLANGPGDAIAIEAIGRGPLTRAGLLAHVDASAAALRSLGLGPRDTAAVVLPNGPEMATAFLATAVAGVSAPLNPAYRRDEFAFYLEDLGARVLIIGDELSSPAREVARERGIRVIELSTPADAPAGVFALNGSVPRPAAPVHPEPNAAALVLHTSGTTARPKLVPLSHHNLAASAAQIARTLELAPADRCLNVMPLFHIHGLMAALLASLHAGASVVCSPGFLSPRFFGWLHDCRPTWYTAVPTMHQAILARAGEPASRAAIGAGRLRFIRSSSASLPRRTLDEIEAVFGVPLIEAYGMTEAAHQMASNPLPPSERKPGSVGMAAGPEIAIMDAAGSLLPHGTTGEVVIRGPAVTAGYVGNAEANAKAFTEGWFRTGDQGSLDADGYLTL
ncbi:MAG: AMP-binding protein, partial [Gemmatimonadota bacterium]